MIINFKNIDGTQALAAPAPPPGVSRTISFFQPTVTQPVTPHPGSQIQQVLLRPTPDMLPKLWKYNAPLHVSLPRSASHR